VISNQPATVSDWRLPMVFVRPISDAEGRGVTAARAA
jgi:hypothetical protein